MSPKARNAKAAVTGGRPHVLRGAQLAQVGFPLGGIGTGHVSLGGRGNLFDWELFNRPSKGLTLQHSFFGVWARPAGKPGVARVLEAEPGPPYTGSYGFNQGAVPGLPRLRAASFSSAYPFARVNLSDRDLPVKARLEAYSPFVPGKDIDSGLPAAVLLWTLTNSSRRKVEASVMASLLNPVGLDGTESLVGVANPAFGGNVNELVHEEQFWALRMGTQRYQPQDVRYGSLSLAVMWPKVSAATRWPRQGGWGMWDLWSIWQDFSERGSVRGPTDAVPSEQGRTDVGTLCALMDLAPGESLTVPFILAWNFPNRVNDWNSEAEVRGKVMRNYYSSWFKDAWAVTKYAVKEYQRLDAETRAFERTFHSSSLPPEILESAGNQVATLRTTTCFRDEEGRFFAFEGSGKGYDAGSCSSGCCPLNCTHVWNYAQTAAFLFPELERSARETDFLVNTRQGGRMSFRTLAPVSCGSLWDFKPAADGQMGTILRLYREWQFSGDGDFLARLWPKAKEALEFAWQGWDADRDGVMEGEQHNTYDIEFYGPNPLTTILYLGALRAGEEMARAMGENGPAAEYRRLYDSGLRRLLDKMWNGEYFQQTGDKSLELHQTGQGCMSDQLLGQFLANVSGLGEIVPAEYVRKTLAAIHKYNFRRSLHGLVNVERVYAHQDEGGLLMCSWPRNGRPKAAFPYADEVWTGTEYHVAAHMLHEGMVAEALEMVRAARKRHDGLRRNPFNEPECGNHYVRGMSSWALVLEASGFRWSAPEASLRFVPVLPGSRFRCFFSTGRGWGMAEQGRSGSRSLVSFTLEQGDLAVKKLRISSELGKLERCWVEPSKTFLRATLDRRKGESLVEFQSVVELRAGQALVLNFGK